MRAASSSTELGATSSPTAVGATGATVAGGVGGGVVGAGSDAPLALDAVGGAATGIVVATGATAGDVVVALPAVGGWSRASATTVPTNVSTSTEAASPHQRCDRRGRGVDPPTAAG